MLAQWPALHAYPSVLRIGHSVSHFSLGALYSGVVYVESSSNRNLFSQKKKREKKVRVVCRSESSGCFNLFRERVPGVWTGSGVGVAGGPRGVVGAMEFMANSGSESTMFPAAAWAMNDSTGSPTPNTASQPAKGSPLLSLWGGGWGVVVLSSRYEQRH